MSEIKCKVEECHYNQSEWCLASTIEVKSRVKDHMVSNTDDTACETFMPKGKSR
ncbi:hypothetical protein SYNTR_0022 [Candidatus Syntrophocurvum alkaliphilum]|uniref:DUF1540 domain-containing protein n=1 Tax=Candidatus Syntrophocurvum alkaliphilum TaxID=2293317 RepID=A0A6I6DAX0_9FIRM|nr:DUF1540 domain-containing protein [Candidatus Syntrophocurvum alkaliphilum]QGT98615.1 hypothetical protein SYNTR_0022 [Candidatus Syntrophocurvum alkaliphilum]